MEWIDGIFSVLGYMALGLFGLIVLAVIFGKRMERRWDLEAKFRDDRGRELGEFDIELKRIVEEGAEWTLEASFRLKHVALEMGREVQVYLDQELVMKGRVEQAGKIRLNEGDLVSKLESPKAGQRCSVRVDDDELFAEELYND